MNELIYQKLINNEPLEEMSEMYPTNYHCLLV